ncbi:hypothetical protein OUZ56_019270 [Daphnia magna]|uniref:Uncharacterized protein n=1 Tax=Daphnia magna TaxID=35525 RepID=A0ABQ9ZB44_9CRUS|nr:hypothetical protein OUZ56_019270 [Daphnia magna]
MLRLTGWVSRAISGAEEDAGHRGSMPRMCQKGPSSTEEDHGTSGIIDGATRSTPWMCQKGPSSTEEDHGTSGIIDGATRSTPWMCQKGPSSTEEDHGTSGIIDGATRSTPWMCQKGPRRASQQHRRGTTWDIEEGSSMEQLDRRHGCKGPSSTEEDHGTSGIIDGATRSTPWMCQKGPSSTEEDLDGTSGIIDGATRSTPWMCQKGPSSTEEDHGTSGIIDGATRSTPWMCQKGPSSTEEDHGTSGIIDGATRSTPWMCQYLEGPQQHRRGPRDIGGSTMEQLVRGPGSVEIYILAFKVSNHKGPSSTEEDHGTSGIIDGATRSTPWMCQKGLRSTEEDTEDRRRTPKIVTGHRGSSLDIEDRRPAPRFMPMRIRKN